MSAGAAVGMLAGPDLRPMHVAVCVFALDCKERMDEECIRIAGRRVPEEGTERAVCSPCLSFSFHKPDIPSPQAAGPGAAPVSPP